MGRNRWYPIIVVATALTLRFLSAAQDASSQALFRAPPDPGLPPHATADEYVAIGESAADYNMTLLCVRAFRRAMELKSDLQSLESSIDCLGRWSRSETPDAVFVDIARIVHAFPSSAIRLARMYGLANLGADNVAFAFAKRAAERSDIAQRAVIAAYQIALASETPDFREDVADWLHAAGRDDALLAAADLYLSVGKAAAAIGSLSRVTAGGGRHSDIWSYLTARSSSGTSEPTTVAGHYQFALAIGQDSLLNRLLSDVRPIVDSRASVSEVAADPTAVRNFLATVWQDRAREAGIGVDRAISEYYQRINDALRMFPGENGSGISSIDEVAAPVPGLRTDVRGVLYIRRGPPTIVLRTVGQNIRPNETWVYGGDIPDFFHFIQMPGVSGWRATSDLLSALDLAGEGNSAGGNLLSVVGKGDLATEETIDLLRSRSFLDSRYGAIAGAVARIPIAVRAEGIVGAGPLVSEIQGAARVVARDMRSNMESSLLDVDLGPNFGVEVGVTASIYGLLSEDGALRLIAAYGVFLPQELSGRPWHFLSDAIIWSGSGAQLGKHTRELRAPSAAGLSWATEDIIPSGDSIRLGVRVDDEESNNVGGHLVADFQLPSLHEDRLSISDVIITRSDGSPTIWLDGRGLSPAAGDLIADGRDFGVYFEVYGLGAAEEYDVVVEIEDTSQGGILQSIVGAFRDSKRVRLILPRGREVTRGARAVEQIMVGSDLEEGSYTMSITVRVPSRQWLATRTREFKIIR